MPPTSDLRYHWVVGRLSAIDRTEMREIVVDAWRMVVPRKVIAAYEASLGSSGGEPDLSS